MAGGAAPGRVAWLSLDNADNDPRTFWSDLLGALAESGAVPQGSPLGDIIPAAGFGATEALQVRSRLADLPSPVVLVLDDFHEITSDTVLETFERLVEHQPAPLRLVVLTRADPVLRLHRLRVSGNLTEIRTHDLAFTEAEAAELFDLQGMHLQPDQLDVLRTRTEGWPAGLRLAAMSLDPADIEGGIARFSGSERSVADYLIGEVIDRLPREDRDFLLKTSIVENLTGDLADQLTGRGDSQQVLERLVGANAFVVAMGEKNEWFSYHPLLRELMRHRLALEQPRAVADLHRLAAQWMTSPGRTDRIDPALDPGQGLRRGRSDPDHHPAEVPHPGRSGPGRRDRAAGPHRHRHSESERAAGLGRLAPAAARVRGDAAGRAGRPRLPRRGTRRVSGSPLRC